MYKAIVSRAYSGVIPEVGTSDRTIFYGRKKVIQILASEYAHGNDYRIEFFYREKFYSDPVLVEYWHDGILFPRAEGTMTGKT
jgi:hypothetical protein